MTYRLYMSRQQEHEPNIGIRIFASTGISMAAVMGLTFLAGVASARALGPDDRGLLAAAMLWPSVMVYSLDLGTAVAMSTSIASRKLAESEGVRAILPLLVLAVAAGFVAACIVASTSHGTEGFIACAMIYAILMSILNLSVRLAQSINQGTRRFSTYNLVTLIQPALWAILSILLWLSGIHTPVAFLIASTCAMAAAALTAMMPYVREVVLPSRADFSAALRIIRVGIPSHLGNMTPIDSMRLDLAYVVIAFSPAEAGFYSVAVAVASCVRLGGVVAGMIGMPNVASKTSSEDRIAAMELSTSIAFWSSFAAGVVGAVLAPVFIHLVFGANFANAVIPTQILCIGMIFASVRQAVGDCLRGAGLGGSASRMEAASWAIAILGVPTLGALYGLPGVAMAVSLSYGVALGLYLLVAFRSGLNITRSFSPRLVGSLILRTQA